MVNQIDNDSLTLEIENHRKLLELWKIQTKDTFDE